MAPTMDNCRSSPSLLKCWEEKHNRARIVWKEHANGCQDVFFIPMPFQGRNLRRLESRLAKKVNEAAQKMTPSNPREPLEIVHAIVETVEKTYRACRAGKIRLSIQPDSNLHRRAPASSLPGGYQNTHF